jgi:uncharacterized membrane protein
METMEKGVLWFLVLGLYATTIIGKLLAAPIGIFSVMITSAFVVAHGARFYGWKNILVFIGITFLFSWCLESLSIATGFPFGNYHYTGAWKIGEVPWIIMPAYLSTGYLSWLIAHILTGHFDSEIGGRRVLLLPFIASFVMVMWDVVMDPIMSTIQNEWVWEDGGFYFGVPLTNYVGWYLTIFLIFFVFALFISRQKQNMTSPIHGSRTYWLVVPLLYLGIALQYLLAPFFATSSLDIYWSLFLVTIYTMVFISIISILRVAEEFK